MVKNATHLPMFPSDLCEESPTHAHYSIHKQLGVFQCKYCGAAKWQPQDIITARDFGADIERVGIQAAYHRQLSKRPGAVALILALHTDFTVRQNVDKETADVVAKVIMPKVKKSPKRKSRAKERLGVKRSVYNE